MTKKKKLLFIMESLGIGGAEKSLLTLLSRLDYENYDVDLFLFRHNGELMKFLPKNVHLLPEDDTYKIFDKNWKTAPFNYLKRTDIKRFWHSMLYLFGCIRQRILRKPLYIGWNHVRYLFSVHSIETDIAVAYLERKCIYFVNEKVSAKKKIGFIHNDYSIYPYDYKCDQEAFGSYDWIATVSDHCKAVLIKIFPEYKNKFLVIKNMVSSQMIHALAEEPLPENITRKPGEKIIVTVGRLVHQKGYDIAVQICQELVHNGMKLKWYAVGEGPERKALQDQIDKLGLHEIFVLVGAQTNPYNWMKMADIYVQPSRFEGFGITVAEAKVLGKPIVCSDIPEFREQLKESEHYKYARNCLEFIQEIQKMFEHKIYDEEILVDVQKESINIFNNCLK